MRSKSILLLVLSIFLLSDNVYAASYNMTLNTNSTKVEKESMVDIYVTLDNINDISDGLNACVFNLEYDSNKIEIIKNNDKSLIGQNGWNVEEGEDILLDNSSSIVTRTNIGKISAKILDNSSITIKNIQCSDGNNDINADNYTLSFSIKQIQNNNTNNDYSSSDTVEPSKTGIKELSITFIFVALVTFIVRKLIIKYDLFKKL